MGFFTSDDTIDRVLGVPGQLLDNERPFRFLTTTRGRPVLLVCFNIANLDNLIGIIEYVYLCTTSTWFLSCHHYTNRSMDIICVNKPKNYSMLPDLMFHTHTHTHTNNIYFPTIRRHVFTLITHQTTL